MNKIVLVGSTGLVGADFVEKYGTDYEIVSFNSKNSENISLPEQFDALVFLAQSEDYKSPTFTQNLFDVNLKLLHQLLLASLGKTQKVLFFSTGSVYKSTSANINEDTPHNLDSSNPYVCSKIMAELLVQSFESFFESIVILRPFFIYGANQKKTMLFASLINNIKVGNPITLNSGRGLIFNPVHARDVSDLINYLILKTTPKIQKINVSGPETIDLGQVVGIMEELLNAKANLSNSPNPPSSMLVEVNETLVPRPKIGIREGLKMMIINS